MHTRPRIGPLVAAPVMAGFVTAWATPTTAAFADGGSGGGGGPSLGSPVVQVSQGPRAPYW